MNSDGRTIGTVIDVHGRVLTIGQDYDAAVIGEHVIPLSAEDEFMKHVMQAFAEAKAWTAANPQDEEVSSG